MSGERGVWQEDQEDIGPVDVPVVDDPEDAQVAVGQVVEVGASPHRSLATSRRRSKELRFRASLPRTFPMPCSG